VTSTNVFNLANGGVGVVLGLRAGALPDVLHWGRAVSDASAQALIGVSSAAVLNSGPDRVRRFSVLPTGNQDWAGTPVIEAHSVIPAAWDIRLKDVEADDSSVTFTFVESTTALEIAQTWYLGEDGLVGVRHRLTNAGEDVIDVQAVRAILPLPGRATELLDLTGRWTAERRPQRSQLAYGEHRRAGRRGRPGHDAPDLLIAGTPGFSWRQGEVWAVHLAWSGNSEYFAERLPEGAGPEASVLGCGEILSPGELRLEPGSHFDTPEALFGWSDAGLDGLSERFHAHVRALPSQPVRPRPLVLNTWEAVYFDHGPDELADLASRASKVGIELFVLDDGWFDHRRSDRSGLGDWWPDRAIWPDGLAPLADLVHRLGMRFGLWFEPEMANPDSQLARTHPDWLLAAPSAGPTAAAAQTAAYDTWRHQVPVNLAHPDAYAYLLESISEVVRQGVDFIKWDHNRDITAPVDQRDGRAGVHAQTVALYRLMGELRARFPDLEIESCASGGGRIDLGIAALTSRVWASDCNDPLERQRIQRWTGLLTPPERIGSHVGEARSHTTGRVASLSFRLATALFCHAGVEWDIRRANPHELAALGRFSALYKELRPLLHGGVTVRADLDGPVYLHGVVSPSRDHAVFAWVRLDTSVSADAARVQFPGLDPDSRYDIHVRTELGLPHFQQVAPPAWIEPLLVPVDDAADPGPPVTLPGEVLTQVGLPFPNLQPAQALLIEFRKV
jgi:alpha-galactosidase